jgi:SAM-dependent methyltransferase
MLAGLFLSSFSALAFEVALIRIFSVSLWHHFAFMVVSIGMLGMGLSGAVQSLLPKLRKSDLLGTYALLLGAAIPLGYALSNLTPFDPARLSWDRVQLFYLAIYYIALSVPFFFFGMVASTAFSTASGRSGLVYGADLLGAGAGSVASVFLIGWAGPEKAVYVISLGALLGAFLMGRHRTAPVLAIAVLLLLVTGPEITKIRMSPYKGLEQALRYPGAEHLKTYRSGFSRVDVFKSPLARFAPGLSLSYLEELPPQVGLSIDGSHISAITKAGGKLDFLRHLPPALAYEIGKRESALLMDPRGGLPVLLAKEYGTETVISVESNPLVVDAVREDYGEFSGNIYSENTLTGLARSLLMRTAERFDIIDLSLTGAAPSGAFGISEDYRLTVEAFKEYFSHLRPGGVLSVSLFILPPPRAELRLLAVAIEAMEEMGIDNIRENIAAIRSWGSICLLFKSTPFKPGEIRGIKAFSKSRRFDLVYYPGIKKEETDVYIKTSPGGYHEAFAKIIDPGTRGAFIGQYTFDVSPVRDDRPFFHYFLRLENLRETYSLMGKKWQYFIEEGYLLPAVFAQAAILSAVLLLLPAVLGRGGRAAFDPVLFYFAFLGLGFMFIEVPLIQKMMLPLENPSYAVAGVLASVLASSGAGSLLSQRYGALRSPYVVAALSAMIIPYGLLINTMAGSLLALALPARFALTFAMVLPAGLLMGIPFPLGIRLLGEKNRELIPWAWAVNACFSVLSPVLATMLAMAVGFKAVFLLGAGMYALAFGVLRKTT